MSEEITQDEFDVWIDSLEDIDHQIAFQRAYRSLGWEYELLPDGRLEPDEDIHDYYSEEFIDALDKAYQDMYMKELMEVLVKKGALEPAFINADGTIGYRAVE
jgi:hypothetical protein